MKLIAGVLMLAVVALVGASTAEAKDNPKEVGKIGPRTYSTINWGRRADLTMRWHPLRQHPYLKIY